MRTMRIVVFLIAVSLGATHAAADPLNFTVGFTGIQSQSVSGGTLRFVDVHIGSNEPSASAAHWNLWVTLTVKRNGATVCQSSVEMVSKVRPAIRPLRFQILHPRLKRPDLFPGKAKVNYDFYSSLEVREPGTSKLVFKTKNAITWEFPGGGTPSCVQN